MSLLQLDLQSDGARESLVPCVTDHDDDRSDRKVAAGNREAGGRCDPPDALVIDEEQLGGHKPEHRAHHRWPQTAEPGCRRYPREEYGEGQLVLK